jgi:thiol-disulfide isomerase/thioredoxin
VKHCFYLFVIIFWARAASVNAEPTGPSVGSIAPDFIVHNLVTGEDTTLSSQRGKVVILTFWASWCPPCKRELPILENAQRAEIESTSVGSVVTNEWTDRRRRGARDRSRTR